MKKKIIKSLLIIILVLCLLIIVSLSFRNYQKASYDIENRIGVEIGNITLSINEHILLAERTIGQYLKYLKEGNYEKAYYLCSPEYREIISLDKFVENNDQVNYESYRISKIIHKTENMYIAYGDIGDNSFEMLILIGDDKFYIVPEPFLKYVQIDDKIKKDNVTYELIGYQINVESCIFDVKITNDKKEDIHISGSSIKMPSGRIIESSNAEFDVISGETKEIEVFFKTSLDFPASFEIEREEETKIRMYQFKLD